MELACPQCDSLHEVGEESFAERDPGQAKCKVCGYVLKEWRGSRVYWIKLIAAKKWPKD